MKISLVLPLFLGIAGHSSIVMAQSAGTFTATGSMATPRSFHTATLLTNGMVLIAGGDDGFHWTGCNGPTQNLPPFFFNKNGLKTMLLGLSQVDTVSLKTDGTITNSTTSEAGVALLQLTQAVTAATTQELDGEPSLGTCTTWAFV